MRLVRALAERPFRALIEAKQITPPGKPGCFFAGASWRCPPDDEPLLAALALSPNASWEHAARAWPGDCGGVGTHVGLTHDESRCWRDQWQFVGTAFRQYLGGLLLHTYDRLSAFVEGKPPQLRLSKIAPKDARVLSKTLAAAKPSGEPDPSAWTPEVRLPFPHDDPLLSAQAIAGSRICVLDERIDRESVSALLQLVPHTHVEISNPALPLSGGLVRHLRLRNPRRAAALADWSRRIQEESWAS